MTVSNQVAPIDDSLWRTSSRSGGGGQCVEVAITPDVVAIRDSKDRHGGELRFDRAAFAGFVEGVKVGEFNPQ